LTEDHLLRYPVSGDFGQLVGFDQQLVVSENGRRVPSGIRQIVQCHPCHAHRPLRYTNPSTVRSLCTPIEHHLARRVEGQDIVLTDGDEVVRGAICFGLHYRHGVERGRQARKHETGSLSLA
jgi:hypothetical protein